HHATPITGGLKRKNHGGPRRAPNAAALRQKSLSCAIALVYHDPTLVHRGPTRDASRREIAHFSRRKSARWLERALLYDPSCVGFNGHWGRSRQAAWSSRAAVVTARRRSETASATARAAAISEAEDRSAWAAAARRISES